MDKTISHTQSQTLSLDADTQHLRLAFASKQAFITINRTNTDRVAVRDGRSAKPQHSAFYAWYSETDTGKEALVRQSALPESDTCMIDIDLPYDFDGRITLANADNEEVHTEWTGVGRLAVYWSIVVHADKKTLADDNL